jgi:hypothetical protein
MKNDLIVANFLWEMYEEKDKSRHWLKNMYEEIELFNHFEYVRSKSAFWFSSSFLETLLFYDEIVTTISFFCSDYLFYYSFLVFFHQNEIWDHANDSIEFVFECLF